MPTPQPRDDQRPAAARRPPAAAGLARRAARRAGPLTGGVCAAAAAAVALAGCGASTTYKASAFNYTAVNPGQLSVAVRVTNTGKASGTPKCTVIATYRSGARGGKSSAKLSGQLAPGKSKVLYVTVPLPGTRPRLIKTVTATC
jgi:hypothetical protein